MFTKFAQSLTGAQDPVEVPQEDHRLDWEGELCVVIGEPGRRIPEDQAAALEVARQVGRAAPDVEGMHVYGPAPAPLAMLRGRHRYRLLVHARRALDVQDVIRGWLGALDWPAKVRVAVDVDPYSFL